MRGFFNIDTQVKVKRVRRAPVVLKRDDENALPAYLDELKVKVLRRITNDLGCSYVQGFTVCPVCGGRADYTWSECQGFIEFDCPGKTCLQKLIGKGIVRNALRSSIGN